MGWERLGIAVLATWKPEDVGRARSYLLHSNNLSRNGRAAMSRRKMSEIRKPGASMPTQTSEFEELIVYGSDLSAGGFLFFLMSHYSMSVYIFSCRDEINYRPMTAYFTTQFQILNATLLSPQSRGRVTDIKRDGFMNDHFHRKLKTHPFPHCSTSVSKARLAKPSCFQPLNVTSLGWSINGTNTLNQFGPVLPRDDMRQKDYSQP